MVFILANPGPSMVLGVEAALRQAKHLPLLRLEALVCLLLQLGLVQNRGWGRRVLARDQWHPPCKNLSGRDDIRRGVDSI